MNATAVAEPSTTMRELIEENRRLAERLENLTLDLEQYRQAAQNVQEQIAAARQEVEAQFQDQIAQLQQQLTQLQAEKTEQINIYQQQLRQQEKIPLLTTQGSVELITRFISQLRESMTNFQLKTGDIKLKVAFGQVGDYRGLVIPTIDSQPQIVEQLQEITLQFDRNVLNPSN